MCYATFSWSRSLGFRVLLGTGLVLLAAFITAYYAYLGDPVFHQNAYAILTATVLLRAMYIMESRLRPFLVARALQRKSKNQGNRGWDVVYRTTLDDPERYVLKRMWTMIAVGLTIFLSGFAIWGLDNKYCQNLRTFRREIGLPWGILLEGHGWW